MSKPPKGKKYLVLVTRNTSETAQVNIYASDPQDAGKKAIALLCAEKFYTSWMPDRGVVLSNPYITGVCELAHMSSRYKVVSDNL